MNILIALILAITCQSCFFPCSPVINGHITDRNTGAAIDDVRVELYENGTFIEAQPSDTAGVFDVTLPTTHYSFFSDCSRPIKLVFIKAGYDTVRYMDTAPTMDIKITMIKN